MRYLILDNIRSAHNVGAIFRTADGAGIDRIYLGGYSPAPIDRFGREVSEIVKTSLGASKFVPWESITDIPALVTRLQSEGVAVVAVEQTDKSISLYDFKEPGSVAYVVGNEIDGVAPAICEVADMCVEIPMQGQKESLNVAVATGIILFNTKPKLVSTES